MTDKASLTESTYNPDQLIVGDAELVRSETGTLLAGQNLTRGAVVGRITIGAVAAAAAAGNTGNGAIGGAAVGSATAPKVGKYVATCIAAVANGGTFLVEDPDGIAIGKAAVGAAFDNQVQFTIADGAADFVVGDRFEITVAEGTDKLKLSAAAALDGSQTPIGILAEDCDATAADAECLFYYTGDFNDTQVALGAGHTVASIRDGLRTRGIYLIPAQAA